ncbi:MAG TPA: hypothetical protein VFP71_07205, partial [Candidatus Angelobacter sp.]|nr:hypothetical protein [Candidatus Angelobacter sp.]
YAHRQMMEARALGLQLPAAEDANSIQVGLMRIQKALIDDTISTKKAGLLLYSMQLALQNVGQVTFGQAKAEEPVRETVSVEEALSNQQSEEAISNRHSAFSQNQKQNQHQTQPFTTEDTESTEENQGLPLMNADDTDLGRAHEEFVPMAEGYGYTRVRLKIEPERRPAEAAIASGDRPESRANLYPAARKIGA